MPCPRESRSAVSAWRLRPLVLMLGILFSVMPHRALSQGLPPPPLSPPVVQNITCNRIPYPFGVRGRSLLGFEVTCGRNNEAMLKIDEHSYKIDYVSVEDGFVVILAGPISQVCYDSNGKQMQTTGIDNISFEGTPFSFSKHNKLVATGYNYRLVASFGNSVTVDSPWLSTTCSSYCNGSSEAVDFLHGVACCEASVPMDAAQQFTLEFDNISGNVTGDEDGTCSAAFFLTQGEQVFMGDRGNRPKPLKDVMLPADDRRMILDWVIGRGTCNQASNYNLAPIYCNNMTGCIDASSGAGYLCKCKAGYDGNLYTADGCLDINECRTSNSNNCSRPEFCHNTEGGFTCSCPHNWIGDGYKTGTGCTEALSPSGFNVCTHPEKNPCTYSAYCGDGQGVVACDCPPGMSGNGWKRGSGCQLDKAVLQ